MGFPLLRVDPEWASSAVDFHLVSGKNPALVSVTVPELNKDLSEVLRHHVYYICVVATLDIMQAWAGCHDGLNGSRTCQGMSTLGQVPQQGMFIAGQGCPELNALPNRRLAWVGHSHGLSSCALKAAYPTGVWCA